MTACILKFENNPSGHFHAGADVKGEIETIFDKQMSVRAILLLIKGEAKVCWSAYRKQRRITFYTEEKYVQLTVNISGSQLGSYITLDEGTHKFPFYFSIPSDAPTSFEGNFGNIRYTATVIFESPWSFRKTFIIPFTVLNIIDLNKLDLSLTAPINKEIKVNFCCLTCANKPLSIEVILVQTGFVCHQVIRVNLNINNQSGKQIKRVDVSLYKIIRYKSEQPEKGTKTEMILIDKESNKFIRNTVKESIHVDLLIPTTPPNISTGIIQVEYEIFVKIIIKGPHLNPTTKIPIVIGSIPIDIGKILDNTRDIFSQVD